MMAVAQGLQALLSKVIPLHYQEKYACAHVLNVLGSHFSCATYLPELKSMIKGGNLVVALNYFAAALKESCTTCQEIAPDATLICSKVPLSQTQWHRKAI